MIGIGSIVLLIAATDRLSTIFHKQFLVAGLIYLVAIIYVAYRCGLRAGLVSCLALFVYVWLIYHFRFSVYGTDPTKMTSSLLSIGVIYPVFALVFGIVQMKLRESAIREFDARAAAERESRQRRQAEAELWASEEIRHLIVESSVDAIIGIGGDGLITTWNPNAEKLVGWSQLEAIGTLASERIVRASDGRAKRDSGQIDFAALGAHKGPHETTIKTKTGESIPVEMVVAHHHMPSGTVNILFLRDISDRKRAQQAVEDLNAGLEERVAERTAQLEAANRELVGFTYSISHDLRAPLRAIVGNSRIVREEAEGALDSTTTERLRRLEMNALKMAELIENLLQFARIGQLALNLREVDLSDMGEAIAHDLKAAHAGSATVEPGMTVYGDPDMIRMLLRNLMENAWKYVRNGDEPVVHVGRTDDGLFYVRDNGIGFDMKYVDKIWDPFERLHREDEYPGTGIGLANCKRIVERHGGRIWAESVLGGGTTVYFQLAPARRSIESRPLAKSMS